MRFLLIDREFESPLWVVNAKRVVGSWCRVNQGRTIDLKVRMPYPVATVSTGLDPTENHVPFWAFDLVFEPCMKSSEVLFWLAYVHFEHLRGMAIDFMEKNGHEEAATKAREQANPTPEMIELINYSIQHADYRE